MPYNQIEKWMTYSDSDSAHMKTPEGPRAPIFYRFQKFADFLPKNLLVR